MATEVPAGFFNAALGMRLTGDPETMYLTFGVKAGTSSTGPISPGSVTTLGTDLANTLKGRLDGDWSFTEMKMQAGPAGPNTPEGGVGPQYAQPLNIAGTSTAFGQLPVNSAHLITKKTGIGGRRNQGRFYFPAVQELGVSDLGILDNGQLSAINTAFGNFLAVLDSSTTFAGMYLLHSFPPGSSGPFLAPTRVTSLICQPVIATQRRRLRK
jgi:hypothetical protein